MNLQKVALFYFLVCRIVGSETLPAESFCLGAAASDRAVMMLETRGSTSYHYMKIDVLIIGGGLPNWNPSC